MRASCSGGLADDRPMSGLRLIASGDSLLNTTSQFLSWSSYTHAAINSNVKMSDLSLCQYVHFDLNLARRRPARLTCGHGWSPWASGRRARRLAARRRRCRAGRRVRGKQNARVVSVSNSPAELVTFACLNVRSLHSKTDDVINLSLIHI